MSSPAQKPRPSPDSTTHRTSRIAPTRSIAAASVAAQLLMARRAIENWWLWIAVDVASVPLYLAKGLYPFAGLYLVYLGLAVWGLLDWRRALATGWRMVPA